MNRILFEKDEIGPDGRVSFGGVRAEHVKRVLHGETGQTLKTGTVDGLAGTSVITAIEGDTVTVQTFHDTAMPQPWADLILAPPRPRVMKRLLPQLATLGVGRIALVGAKKTEKDFWGATLLKEENYRPLLIDGLMQGGTTAMPHLEMRRSFRKFAIDELDSMFPTEYRIVAHPYASAEKAGAEPKERRDRLLLAIGPEGGWTDDEVALLEEKGFRRYSLGPRILRTDTAAIGLLVKLNNEQGEI
ncbi:MAG: RNA methyltransferase [Kiritimatiellae bacterium]|nr:RNA methyltransferase [Kiritimatiellia bacterium]